MKTTTPKTPSIHDLDLTDKIVVISGYADSLGLFHCKSGFGCNPNAMGSKIMGTFLSDGEETYIHRPEVVRLADDADLQALKDWESMEPHMKFQRQLEAQDKQVLDASKRVRAKKWATREELMDMIDLLWRRYVYTRTLVSNHFDYISRKETEKPE